MKSVIASVALVASVQALPELVPTFPPSLLSSNPLRTGAQELRTAGTQLTQAATGTGRVFGETYNPSNLATIGRDQAANMRNVDLQQLGQGLRTDAQAYAQTGANLPAQLPASGEAIGTAFYNAGVAGVQGFPTAGPVIEKELTRAFARGEREFATVAPALMADGQALYRAFPTAIPRAAGLFQAEVAGFPTAIPRGISVFQKLAKRADEGMPTVVPHMTKEFTNVISNPGKAARDAERAARRAERAARKQMGLSN